MKIISTPNAPTAVGPYSQAVMTNNLVFCSGQIGIDPNTGSLQEGIENQTRQALNNINEVVRASGSDLNHILKTTIYLSDMNNYALVNKIYGEYFRDHKPARATVEVSRLPKDALIEIEAIAVII